MLRKQVLGGLPTSFDRESSGTSRYSTGRSAPVAPVGSTQTTLSQELRLQQTMEGIHDTLNIMKDYMLSRGGPSNRDR